jgi:hypothetical protein
MSRLVVGVVAGADEGAGLDDLEAAGEAFGGDIANCSGVDPAVDGEVVAGGLEVLADGEDVARVERSAMERESETVGRGPRIALIHCLAVSLSRCCRRTVCPPHPRLRLHLVDQRGLLRRARRCRP